MFDGIQETSNSIHNIQGIFREAKEHPRRYQSFQGVKGSFTMIKEDSEPMRKTKHLP
jgi:hypothetical protein